MHLASQRTRRGYRPLIKVGDIVTADAIMQWIIIAVFAAIFLYKELPGFINWIKHAGKVDGDSLSDRIDSVEKHQGDMDQKLDRDYVRINRIEEDMQLQKKETMDSKKERQLLMNSILAMLKALQELGADGETGIAKQQEELESFLSGKAHE